MKFLDKYRLKNRNFNILIIGQCGSMLGSQMQSFALALYVLKITGSGTKFALMLMISLIPKIILGPICGVFADWFDRKKTMVILDFISGALIAFMFLLSLNKEIPVTYIYVCILLMAFVGALYSPVVSTVIPTIIEKENLLKANSINNFTLTLINIAAPVLAGVIYGLYGITVIFMVNALSFILGGILEMFMVLPKNKKKVKGHVCKEFKGDFIEGIKFIFSHKTILILVLCAFVANIVLNPVFSVGVPFICKMVLKVTDANYGIAEAIMLGGSIVAPILVTVISKKMGIKEIFYGVTFIVAILMLLMAINVSNTFISLFDTNVVPFITFILIGFLVGFVVTILNICLFTLIQGETPNELLGRVSSVLNTTTMGAVPLGQMLFGVLFDKLDAYIPVFIASIVFIILSIFVKCSSKEKIESVVESEIQFNEGE